MVVNRTIELKREKTIKFLSKEQWVQHARYVEGKKKAEGLESWARAEKVIQSDGIEYGLVCYHHSTRVPMPDDPPRVCISVRRVDRAAVEPRDETHQPRGRSPEPQ